MAFTYTPASLPPITVVAALRGNGNPVVVDFNDYVPVNGDTIVTWYGNVHTVQNDTVYIQQFEQDVPVVVLPYRTMIVLDTHHYTRID